MDEASLAVTFDLLTRSENAAAADVLLLALDSEDDKIRDGALEALLVRRDKPYQLDLVARWESAGDRYRSLIAAHPGRLAAALRQAIAEPSRNLFHSAMEIILATSDYDLAPALIAACEQGGPQASAAGDALLSLIDQLHEEWLSGGEESFRREASLVRTHALFALERSLERFDSHRAAAPVEAFVMLADRDNESLRNLLANPRRSAHRALVKSLTHSRRGGVTRLLLSFLDDLDAPAAISHVLAHRDDEPFVRASLQALGEAPSSQARMLLKRMDGMRWLERGPDLFERLTDAEQSAVAPLVVLSGMPRLKALDALKMILRNGRPPARRMASAALAEFQGAQANQLVLDFVADSDPVVQATLVRQLREKNIPAALSLLLERVDSEHAEVRLAVSENLAEFRFSRYLAAFEMLSSEARSQTGALVLKIDPTTIDSLAEELASTSRTRRLRAIAVAESLHVVEELLNPLTRLLVDDDGAVRKAAEEALGAEVQRGKGAEGKTEERALLSSAPLSLCPFAPFLAQTGFDLSSKTDPANVAGFVFVILLLAALAAGLWLLKRYLTWRDRPALRSAPALFRELCRAHRLGWGEQRLLARMAKSLQVHPPARLFLEPGRFDEWLTSGAAASQASSLKRLKAKLFGSERTEARV